MKKRKVVRKQTVEHKGHEYSVDIIREERHGLYLITVNVLEKFSPFLSLFFRKVLYTATMNYHKMGSFSYKELAERAVEAYHDENEIKNRKANMEIARLKEFEAWDGVMSDE